MKNTTLLLKTLAETQQIIAASGGNGIGATERALETLGEACSAERVSLIKLTETNRAFQPVAQFTADGVERRMAAANDFDILGETEPGFESALTVPIFQMNRLTGAIHIESKSNGLEVDSSAKRLAEGTAILLAPYLGAEEKPANLKLTKPTKGENVSREEDDDIHILIVEDDEANLSVIKKFIERFGAVPHLALNGRDAVAQCREMVFDVILMDLTMPELDGFDATREIVTGNTPNRNTPIVAVTADITDGIERRCRKTGMQHYIAKPIRRDTIIQVLTELTNKKSPTK